MKYRWKHLHKSKIVEVCGIVLETILVFEKIYNDFKKNKLNFDKFAQFVDDKGESILFDLKELCHYMFRGNTHYHVSDSEHLFDITVSTLFHVSMKIREDVYQEKTYWPKLKEIGTKKDKSGIEQNLLQQFQKIQPSSKLDSEMDEAKALLEEVKRQFIALMSEYQNNGLLIRYLVENSEQVKKALGKNGFKQMFSNIQGGNWDEINFVIALSYLDSGYYDKAIKALDQITKKSRNTDKLFIYHLSKGLAFFQEEEFNESLKEFGKALDLIDDSYSRSDYLKLMQNHIGEMLYLKRLWNLNNNEMHKDEALNLSSKIEKLISSQTTE